MVYEFVLCQLAALLQPMRGKVYIYTLYLLLDFCYHRYSREAFTNLVYHDAKVVTSFKSVILKTVLCMIVIWAVMAYLSLSVLGIFFADVMKHISRQ